MANKKNGEPMKKRGAPESTWTPTPEILTIVKTIAGYGLTDEQIFEFLGLKKDVFYKKIKKYPELRLTIDDGRARAVSFVAGKLFELIKKGNVAATIFWLKVKAGYSEKQFLSIGGDASNPAPIPLKFDTTDPQEAAKIYTKFMSEK